MTRTKRSFSLPEFETCSLALFAALTLGAAAAPARAQVFGPANAPSRASAAASGLLKSGPPSTTAALASGMVDARSLPKPRVLPVSAVRRTVDPRTGAVGADVPASFRVQR